MNIDFSDLKEGLDKQDMLEVYFMEKFYEKAETDFVAAVTALIKGNIYSADKSFKNMYKDFEKENNGEAVTYKEFVAVAGHTIDTYKAMLPLAVGLKVASERKNVNAIFDAYYKTLDNEFNESLDPDMYPLSAQEPTVVEEPAVAPTPTVVEEPAVAPTPTVVEEPAVAQAQTSPVQVPVLGPVVEIEPALSDEQVQTALTRYNGGSLPGKETDESQSTAVQNPVGRYLSTSSLGSIDRSKE